MRGGLRRWILVAGLLVPACGLSVVGVDPEGITVTLPDGAVVTLPPGSDASNVVVLEDGAVVVDASEASTPPATPCEQACLGGTCDKDGVCQLGGASDGKIVCPAGVPCAVTCNKDECKGGVDCTKASACTIKCNGMGSCGTGSIDCGGSKCDVACNADGSCAGGVHCSAKDECHLHCTGKTTCKNSVRCNSADCTIECLEDHSCDDQVSCTTTGTCDINCGHGMSCTGQKVTASGGASNKVNCADDACQKGVSVSGTISGTITCGGKAACGERSDCAAGTCTTNCAQGQKVCRAALIKGGDGCDTNCGF